MDRQTHEWLRTPKVQDELTGGWTIDDESGMEIVLVFGFSPRSAEGAGEYWYAVWEWMRERFVGCWETDEFPDDWASDPTHEADMEILSAVHRWQEEWRHKLEV